MHGDPPLGAPETKNILALIFNETALMAGKQPPRDGALHDNESFDAFMASCQDGAPTQKTGNHIRTRAYGATTGACWPYTGPCLRIPPGTSSPQLCYLEADGAHPTAAGDEHAGGRPVELASQHPRAQDAPHHGIWTPAAAGSITGPIERMPPRVAQPVGQESLDYAQQEGDAQRPSAEADRAAALDLDLWLPLTSDVEQLSLQVRTRWILMDIHHIMHGTRTMAEVIFEHHKRQHSPPPAMEHPSQWQYVATGLMAQMGAYTPGSLDRPDLRRHHRAALRIREALLRQNILTIRTFCPRGPPAPRRATKLKRQQSPITQGPLRHAPANRRACTDEPPRLRPHALHNGAHSGCSPTPGRFMAISALQKWKLGNTPLGRRRRGPGDRQASEAKVAHRPQQRSG